MRVLVLVEELREGDQFVADGYLHWTALAKVNDPADPEIRLHVQFGDGGRGWRSWKRGEMLEVERPDNAEGAP